LQLLFRRAHAQPPNDAHASLCAPYRPSPRFASAPGNDSIKQMPPRPVFA
jgi:hypothetical protein